jgi:hypothetical protein
MRLAVSRVDDGVLQRFCENKTDEDGGLARSSIESGGAKVLDIYGNPYQKARHRRRSSLLRIGWGRERLVSLLGKGRDATHAKGLFLSDIAEVRAGATSYVLTSTKHPPPDSSTAVGIVGSERSLDIEVNCVACHSYFIPVRFRRCQLSKASSS